MKIKTSLATGLAIVLVAIASIFLIPSAKVKSGQDFVQTEIPVVIKPLKTADGIVSVEIQCGKVSITEPDTLDDFTCYLINRTDKSIRSSIVGYSIISDSNGEEKRDNRLDTTDAYIHPDFADVKKPIEPGGKLSIMPPGPITLPGSIIKRLELEPFYLEFSDETTIGIGGKSAEMIAKVREGATRYKNSLRREYLNKGKSSQAILPLLEDEVPIDSEITGFAQQMGAKAYRRLLRKKYEKKGIAAIKETLDK